MDLLQFMMELDLVLKKVRPFSIGLDIWYLVIKKKIVLRIPFPHIYARIKIDPYDYLPLEKTITLHNIVILNKSVFNKNQHHYYYNIFLEKCSFQLSENNEN